MTCIGQLREDNITIMYIRRQIVRHSKTIKVYNNQGPESCKNSVEKSEGERESGAKTCTVRMLSNGTIGGVISV